VVPLVRGGRGEGCEEKEVTAHFASGIKFSLGGNFLEYLMNNKNPFGVGPLGRWVIFSGIPLSVWAVFFAVTEPHHALEHAVGEKIFPYVLAGAPASIMIGGMICYNYFPKKLVVPLGIIGWIINISIFCWFFWFGPGAFGHS
jgi:hypothetical protein